MVTLRIQTILFLLLSCMGCAHDSGQLNAHLQTAATLMREEPDSALTILRKIDPENITRKATQARYALLYSQALDKNYIDLTSDSLIRPAVEYYKNHGRRIDKAKAFYYLARIYENAGDMEPAIESYVEARKYMEGTRARQLLAMLYANVANLYTAQSSYPEAAEMYDLAISAYHGLGHINEAYALSGKANVLHLQSQYQEALALLEQAAKIASRHNDADCYLYIVHSRAAVLSDMGDSANYAEIKRLLTDAYGRYADGEFAPDIYPLLASCYYQEDKIDSARYFMRKALDNMDEYAIHQIPGLYGLSAQIAEAGGDVSSAKDYLRQQIIWSDSLHEADKSNLVQELEQKYHTRQIEESYLRLRHQHIVITVFALLVIVIFGGLAWIIYRRKQTLQAEYLGFADSLRRDYDSLSERHIILEKELGQHDEKAHRLFSALDNRLKELRKIMELAGTFEDNPAVFYEKLRKHFKMDAQKSGTVLSDLLDMTNIYCNGIIDSLRIQYPDLTDDDLALSCMICLGFTPQQTRLLFNHTNCTSIYQKRSKLRKKLNLADSENLEDFFAGICRNDVKSEVL